MAPVTESALRLEPLPQVEEAWAVWPRGDRPGALRAAAASVRGRLQADGHVEAVRTVDLAVRQVPSARLLPGAVRPLAGTAAVVDRLVVVRFRDLDGASRILVWDVHVADTPAVGPGAPPPRGEKETVTSALALLGLRPQDVDVCAFSHLHDRDPRLVLGTEMAVGVDRVPRAPLFPDADVLISRRETDTLRAPHPMQRARYTGALHGLRTDRLRELDGSVLLGAGVAIIATPGHTDGHCSLAISTSRGVWVVSAAGHVADAWHPHLSRAAGVRRHVEGGGQEVLVAAEAEDAVDQHDAMLLERAVADAHHTDPRWRCVLPVSEVLPSRRLWPLRPTFVHGGIDDGVLGPRAV